MGERNEAVSKTKLGREHEVLLAAVERLGESDRQIELGAELPASFLVKARAGQREGPKSEPSWARLRAFLERAGVLAPVPAPSESPPEVPEEIARGFETATNAEELLEVGRRVAAGTARRVFDPRTSDVLQGWSRELRQTLEMAEVEKARAEFANLAPVTLDQLDEFYALQESNAPKSLAPGQGVPPPEAKS